MAGIVNKIEIYNQAYKIAWSQISADDRLTAKQRSEAGLFLHDAIKSSIWAGRTDAALIAVAAVADIQCKKTVKPEDRLPD